MPKTKNAIKADGVICVFKGFYKLLQTQRFKSHFMSTHKKGQPWSKTFREDYERPARGANMLTDPDGHKIAIPLLLQDLIARLDAIDERQERIERLVLRLAGDDDDDSAMEDGDEDSDGEENPEDEDEDAQDEGEDAEENARDQEQEHAEDTDGEAETQVLEEASTPPPKRQKRARASATPSSPAMNTRLRSQSR